MAKAEELSQTYRGTCIPIACDVSSKVGIDYFTKKISEKEEGIDFLINNAGAAWGEPFDSFSESGWDKVMDLNVKSLFFLTQKLSSLLKTRATLADPSRVINIGSIDGLNVPAFETYSYSTSKAAVHHLTRVLAAKLVKENILVNAIAPGPYPSQMLGAAVNHDYSELADRNPRNRVGKPEDIAGLSIFLCSKAGSYIVGETIASDGGIVKTAGHNLG
jgi:2-deoxy-D-gluconate 3-dehydrogenase